MLVLSRRVQESIWIGDVIVTVCEVRHGKVRLGVTADRNVPVHREEVYQAMQQGHPIQAGPEQVSDLGRRGEFLEEDEVLDAFVEQTMIDHGV